MDEDEKDRLLAQAYSRASAGEREQAFLDPDTGETLRMRPSEWELHEYERRVAAESPDPSDGPPMPAEAAESAAGDAALPAASAAAPNPAGRRNRLIAGIGIAAVLGFLLGAQVSALTGTAVEEAVEPTATPSLPPPLDAIEGVFVDPAFGAVDPGPAVTDQFDPGSFRVIATQMPAAADDAVQVYAARRGSSRFCLVVADAGVRVASVCGTAEQIAEGGLLIEKPLVGDGVAAGTHVVVEWRPDGTLVWRTTTFAEGVG